MKGPLVSVIMPAYNAEQFIYPAMTSILAQTYENHELIIVDDGSTDNTYDIVRSFNDRRIILIKNHKNLNLARSLNIAIDAAKGKYICRSDADDLNMPTRLEKQLEFMESHPDIDVVGSNMYVFTPEGDFTGGIILKNTHNDLIRHVNWFTPLPHATIMARADWMRKYKYREVYARAQDYELFLRSYRQSRFANLADCLYAVRDPERLHLEKMLHSSWDNMIMRWRHWQEYGIPIHAVLAYPLLLAARLLYYTISLVNQNSFWWGHLRQFDSKETFFIDQEWVRYCLRRGGHC
jgi:glycosyltransferase involved in cell wall biosynthesis